jgi:hypothetical protein
MSYLTRGGRGYRQEAWAERGRVVVGPECKMFVDLLTGSNQFEVRRLSDQRLKWVLVILVARVSCFFLTEAHGMKTMAGLV